jgi:hypothetical protein
VLTAEEKAIVKKERTYMETEVQPIINRYWSDDAFPFVAEGHFLDAVALAEQHAGPDSVAAALPLSLLAPIRYEQGRIDEAEGMVFDRLPILSTTAMLR